MSSPSKVTSKSQRDYSIIVLGAAGYTGRLVAHSIAELRYSMKTEHRFKKWAISGRNYNKLVSTCSLLKEASNLSGT